MNFVRIETSEYQRDARRVAQWVSHRLPRVPATGPAPPAGAVRLRDWREVYEPQSDDEVSIQGARCMDCGIPFCMQGCPLGNRIPTFNDHVYRAHWEEAAEQLFDTNNFPEFTGRLCPAPCESACVLGISDSPVTIERIEYEVVEHAFAHGYRRRRRRRPPAPGSASRSWARGRPGWPPPRNSRAWGTRSHVFERSDAIGGLLRYGIPEFKLEKAVLERRLAVMAAAGVTFHTNVRRRRGRHAARGPAARLRRRRARPRLDETATDPRAGSGARRRVPGDDVSRSGQPRGARRGADAHRRRAIATSSSWAAATPAPTASAPCTVRARARSCRSRSSIVRPTSVRRTSPGRRWRGSSRRPRPTTKVASGASRPRRWSSTATERVERIVVRDDATGETITMPADLVLIAAGFVGPELDAPRPRGRALRHAARDVVGRRTTGASRHSTGRRRSSPAATPFAGRA